MKRLELTDLRLFVQVAEAGNLTAGARRAFLSAPAASARIRAMEEDFAQPLLIRGNRGVALTQAGEVVLRHARLVLRQLDYLTDELSGDGMRGHVRILANTTAATEFMPEVLARFMATRPGVTVDLQERLTHDILRGVEDGSADLGIVSGEVVGPGLEALRFSTDRLLLAAPLNHPLARGEAVDFADTLQFEQIGLHEGSTLLDFLRRQFARAGYDRALRVQVRSFEAMCRMVEAGVGLGVVPETAALRHARTMRLALIRLRDAWALRNRYVVAREMTALPASARAIVALLQETRAGGGAE